MVIRRRRTPSSSVSKPVPVKESFETSDYRSEHFTTVLLLSELNKRPIVSIKSRVSSRVKGLCYPHCLNWKRMRIKSPKAPPNFPVLTTFVACLASCFVVVCLLIVLVCCCCCCCCCCCRHCRRPEQHGNTRQLHLQRHGYHCGSQPLESTIVQSKHSNNYTTVLKFIAVNNPGKTKLESYGSKSPSRSNPLRRID